MPTLEEARIHDAITRAEMAKMISVYAQVIMQQQPNSDKLLQCSVFNDRNKVNKELQMFIIQACQLGLMGYQANGIAVQTSFRPNDTITRAEIGIILSRLLRGNLHAGDEINRYQTHLQALKNAEIIKLTDNPMMIELRGNIFIMLQRMSLM